MESRSDWLACFLSTLESEQRYQFALTHATQTYYLKPYNIIHLTPAKIHTLYQYLDSKYLFFYALAGSIEVGKVIGLIVGLKINCGFIFGYCVAIAGITRGLFMI
jgi:hypothetical protein